MYKHNAESIKETQDKQFVSLEDKNRWNNKADGNHTHIDMYYTNTEIEEVTKEKFIQQNSSMIHSKSNEGFVKDLEIFGNTKIIKPVKLITPGYVQGSINANGENETDEASIRTTGFIEVDFKDTVELVVISSNTNNPAKIFFYNSNKEFIKHSDGLYTKVIIDSMDIKYIRFCGPAPQISPVRLRITKDISKYISSVGDIINEHGSISLISCGKNLLNIPKVFTKKLVFNGDISHRVVYCKLKPNTDYTISGKYIKTQTEDVVRHSGISINLFKNIPLETDHWFIIQDNKNIIRNENPNGEINITFNSEGYSFFAIYVGIATGPQFNNDITLENFQLEVGTKKTKYEPYQEYNLDLTLPFPLDKVGDVEDRLYVRDDGMVCVDKKIGTYHFTGNETWFDATNDSEGLVNCFRFDIDHTNTPIPNFKIGTGKYIISNKFGTDYDYYKDTDEELIFNGTVRFVTNILKSRLRINFNTNSVDAFKLWLKENDYYIKYQFEIPETIEIGHISDLTLKTFSGNTTIYTDTGSLGRIKCSIPVSLDSSIDSTNNTIKEISNELDDINNLTRKASNLYINETGAVVVPNSIPGFSSDLELKGRTLVNRAKDVQSWSCTVAGTVTNEGRFVKVSPNGSWTKLYTTMYLKPNSEYILYITCRNSSNGECNVYTRYCDDVNSKDDIIRTVTFKSSYFGTESVITRTDSTGVLTLSIESGATGDIYVSSVYFVECNGGDILNSDYFNGLASVGTNIELLSYSTKNLYNTSMVKGFIGDNTGTLVDSNTCFSTKDFIPVPDNSKLVNVGFKIPYTTMHHANIYFYDKNKKYLGFIHCPYDDYYDDPSNKHEFKGLNINLLPNTKYIKFRVYEVADPSKFTLEECFVSTTVTSFVQPSVYSQKITLSEPLRSLPNGTCDTIEKINGKYYVIRRCGGKIINGSENWKMEDNPDHQMFNIYRMMIHLPGLKLNRPNILSDLFTFKTNYDVDSLTGEGIFGSITGNQSGGTLFIDILKTKLVGVDVVTEFKNWLSLNNVSIVYELISYSMEPLDIDPNIRLFDGDTVIDIKTDSALTPTISLSIPQNLNNVVHSILDKIETLEESDIYTNRLQLNSTYQADKTSYSFALATLSDNYDTQEYDEELFELFLSVILAGKENYNKYIIEEQIDFYTITNKFSYDMADVLFNMIEEQNIDFGQEFEC